MTRPVIEIVIFKVKDPEAGMDAARALVADARAYNNAILSAELYQASSDPHMLTQRIEWTSLEAAKQALAASEKFPSMADMMGQVSEQIFLDHFYRQDK